MPDVDVNIKISELPSLSDPLVSESLLPLVQAGETFKGTFTNVLDYIQENIDFSSFDNFNTIMSSPYTVQLTDNEKILLVDSNSDQQIIIDYDIDYPAGFNFIVKVLPGNNKCTIIPMGLNLDLTTKNVVLTPNQSCEFTQYFKSDELVSQFATKLSGGNGNYYRNVIYVEDANPVNYVISQSDNQSIIIFPVNATTDNNLIVPTYTTYTNTLKPNFECIIHVPAYDIVANPMPRSLAVITGNSTTIIGYITMIKPGQTFRLVLKTATPNPIWHMLGPELQSINNFSDIQYPETARTNLGLGTLSLQDADDVVIGGGTIDGTKIGGFTPADAIFTTIVNNVNTNGTIVENAIIDLQYKSQTVSCNGGIYNLDFTMDTYENLGEGYWVTIKNTGVTSISLRPPSGLYFDNIYSILYIYPGQTITIYLDSGNFYNLNTSGILSFPNYYYPFGSIDFTISNLDFGYCRLISGSDNFTINLPDDFIEVIQAGFNCIVRNIGTGTGTFTVNGDDVLLGGITQLTPGLELGIKREFNSEGLSTSWFIELLGGQLPIIPVDPLIQQVFINSTPTLTISNDYLNGLISFTNVNGCLITIPNDSDIISGSFFDLEMLSTNNVLSFTQASGIRFYGDNTVSYSQKARLQKIDSDSWLLFSTKNYQIICYNFFDGSDIVIDEETSTVPIVVGAGGSGKIIELTTKCKQGSADVLQAYINDTECVGYPSVVSISGDVQSVVATNEYQYGDILGFQYSGGSISFSGLHVTLKCLEEI